MPYTTNDLLSDLASLDNSVVSLLANFPAAEQPAPIEHTRQQLNALRNSIATIRDRYVGGCGASQTPINFS